MRVRIILIVIVLLGIISIGISAHEIRHLFQKHSARWEMCATNNIDEYNTIAFVKWRGYGVTQLSEEVLKKSEILPTFWSIFAVLFCTIYCIKNRSIFVKKE